MRVCAKEKGGGGREKVEVQQLPCDNPLWLAVLAVRKSSGNVKRAPQRFNAPISVGLAIRLWSSLRVVLSLLSNLSISFASRVVYIIIT